MAPAGSYRVSFRIAVARRDAPARRRPTLTLHELTGLLRQFASSEIPLSAIHAQLLPLLAADPLDVSVSDASRWEAAPDEERLFWRLVYLLDAEPGDEERMRSLAARVVAMLACTGSPDATHDLLPLLVDQSRLVTVIDRHRRGVISRTGWLSFVAECGYAEDVKLWLRHASPAGLGELARCLAVERYDSVLALFEAAPG